MANIRKVAGRFGQQNSGNSDTVSLFLYWIFQRSDRDQSRRALPMKAELEAVGSAEGLDVDHRRHRVAVPKSSYTEKRSIILGE